MATKKCQNCHGTGKIICYCTDGDDRATADDDCFACGGTGVTTCPACDGSGREED